MGLPSSCLFPPARRWAPTAGLLFFLDKRQFHSPPLVRCVHIALPALPRARTHCLTPAAMRVPYRCWRSRRAWHRSYHFSTLEEKIQSLQLVCSLLNPVHSVFSDSICVCLVLVYNPAPFLSPAVPADEMASVGRPWICRTKRLPFSNTRAFSK